MSWDLDDILRAAGADRERPGLIEVGRAIGPGPVTAGYFWSTGRISATVGAHRVTIKRRRGVVSDDRGPSGLQLDVDELKVLSIACAAWTRDRDTWAAFYYSSSGYPPGYGGACYYLPPGKDGARIKIGSSGPHHRDGGELIGRDVVRPIERRRLDDRVAVIAELWREGEEHGHETGSLVGLRYEIDAALFVDERRQDLRAWRDSGGSVCLEPGEEAFVAAVLDMLQQAPR